MEVIYTAAISHRGYAMNRTDAAFVVRALKEFLGVESSITSAPIGEDEGKVVRGNVVLARIREDGATLATLRTFDSVKSAVEFIAPADENAAPPAV